MDAIDAPTFTKSGAKATAHATLDASIFGVEITNHELLKLAYTAYLANGRDNYAQVKTRGLVSGGGRKPWKQKGTGRARFGSSRNPIWRGGGIVFGPTGAENYRKCLSVSAKRQALRQALSLAVAENKVRVIDSFVPKDGKTAQAVKLLDSIGARGRVVLVVDSIDDILARATANIPDVLVTNVAYLSVYDSLNADTLVVTKKALDILHSRLALSVDANVSKGGKA